MSEGASQPRGMRRLYATALELGPLLLFFVANGKWGIFIGTGVFVVATAIALPCYRWLEKRWPVMPLVGGFFVLVFGGLTIWLQDDTFIKLKPTIVNCLFGVILGGGLLFLQRPLLKPIFGAAFKLTDEGWRKLTLRWALFFFVLAAVNEVMWRGFSTETWIGSKMFLSFPLTLRLRLPAGAVAQALLGRRPTIPSPRAAAAAASPSLPAGRPDTSRRTSPSRNPRPRPPRTLLRSWRHHSV